MIDADHVNELLRKLAVPRKSPRADDIRSMIDEAVLFVEKTQELHPGDLEIDGTFESEDAAWITIEPAHVSFYV